MASNYQHKYDNIDNFITKCKMHVNTIKKYLSKDPLATWYNYLLWMEENFVIDYNKETIFDKILGACLSQFEKDERYKQDRRLIKLFIKYIHFQDQPVLHYEEMVANGVGDKVADLYINWAFYYEINGRFLEADKMFKRGITAQAKPLDLLKSAHVDFGFALSQRMLRNDNQSQQQERLEEISSIRLDHKRTNNLKSLALQMFNQAELMNACIPSDNIVKKTQNKHNTSIAQNIIDSVEKLRQKLRVDMLENVKRCHNFDESSYELKPKANVKTEPLKMPLPMEDNVQPVTSYNFYRRTLPGYDKNLLNPADNLAFSQEELKAYQWFTQRNIINEFTLEQDAIWGVGYTVPIRWPKECSRQNLPQTDWISPRISPLNFCTEDGTHKFMFKMAQLYPNNSFDEYSFEEIMWQKCKSTSLLQRKTACTDQMTSNAMSNATMKSETNSKRSKAFPNQPKDLRFAIHIDRIKYAPKIRNIALKTIFESNANKENLFIDENQLANLECGQSRDFPKNRLRINSVSSPVKVSDESTFMINDVKQINQMTKQSSPVKTILDENVAITNQMFATIDNAIKDFEQHGKNINDSFTSKKNPALEYSFSYESLETTADFEHQETLGAISPIKQSVSV